MTATDAKSPARTKGQQRTVAVLDAAIAVLIEEGYAGFSLRRIADRVGIRLSNVQYYFQTKESLLEAILAREFDRSLAILAGLSPDLTPRARLETIIDYVLADQENPASCAIFWELWALAPREPAVAAIMDHYYGRFIGYAAAEVRALSPGIGEDVALRRANVMVSMMEGASLLRGAGKPRQGDPALAADIKALCLSLAGAP